ncbi:MAG TPA: dienelactone hydrolase family protein [Gemmatimonadaceae bacterium]|nr:dienelactone hydrolase family protein [Gemmatimonadaceae bacterium]
MPTRTELKLKTQDGVCDTYLFQPDGPGPWPAVLMYMDGIGMRPALWEVADRIAAQGYWVMLPDLFYRVGYKAEYGVNVFTNAEQRADLMTRIMPSASASNVMRDTDALLAHAAQQPNVRHEKIGITGYCMGGRLAMYAAGYYGDRVAAAAAYHPGGLATDAPDSPHTLAPNMRAQVYVGAAMEDQSFDAAQKERFDQALTDAGVAHTIETYQARHGFVPPDTPAYDAAAAARHDQTLFGLLRSELPRA